MKTYSDIIASIASCNLLRIEEEVRYASNKCDNLHIDIEDGNFEENITFGLTMVKAIRSITSVPFSVHLMVSNPKDYIEELSKLNCSHIFIHVEYKPSIVSILQYIKDLGMKAGIALYPVSNIADYQHLYNCIDAVLYMTSEIDGKGNRFIESMLSKIIKIDNKEIWVDGDITLDNKEIWVDGDITLDKKERLQKFGVTHFVMGREFFRGER